MFELVSWSSRSSSWVIVVSNDCSLVSLQWAWKPTRIFVILATNNIVFSLLASRCSSSSSYQQCCPSSCARVLLEHYTGAQRQRRRQQQQQQNKNNDNNRRTNAGRVGCSCARDCLATSCSCLSCAHHARAIAVGFTI